MFDPSMEKTKTKNSQEDTLEVYYLAFPSTSHQLTEVRKMINGLIESNFTRLQPTETSSQTLSLKEKEKKKVFGNFHQLKSKKRSMIMFLWHHISLNEFDKSW